MQIALDHLQRGMTKDDLEVVNVPAVLKVASGEGVPQEMGMDPRNSALALELCGEVFESVNGDGFTVDLADEMRGIGAAIDVLTVVIRAELTKRNISLLIAFAIDDRIAFIEVHPFCLQRADLTEA